MKALLQTAGKLSGALFLVFFVITTIQAQTGHAVTVSDFTFSPATLEIQVGDTVIWTNTLGSHNVNGTQETYSGNPASFGNDIGTGWTYSFVFTEPGTYDYQCDPHVAMGMTGEIIVNEEGGGGNGQPIITLDFSSMNPHIGQMLVIYIVDNSNDTYLDTITINEITEADFSVDSIHVDSGGSYRIDFYADLNDNGTYDAPPADHAWRIEIDELVGDTVIAFVHNTEFTDIFETPTGVNNRNITRVVLYPNPAGDYIKVSGDDLPAGNLDVRIFNITGQVVRSIKATNNGNLTIDLTGLSKGAYYLLLESNGFKANGRFVKSY
ncbi:T9SS C-terminal target domain-containing protein [bacterium]|nr:MAG: T9SS C-terminal target domain-containing protein [bacterium]